MVAAAPLSLRRASVKCCLRIRRRKKFAQVSIRICRSRPAAIQGPHRRKGRDPLREVAERFSKAVGRTISYRLLSIDVLAKRHLAPGVPPIAAEMLAGMDAAIAAGAENRVTACVETLTDRPPVTFNAFVEAHAGVWSVRR